MKTAAEIVNEMDLDFASENDREYYKQQIIHGMEIYADQFKYDFSKGCECKEGESAGETWCCNLCGLPTSKKTSK